MIVIIAGLPGTGKSTLARALAQRLSAAVLDKDVIRASLFEPPYIEYSLSQDDFCEEIMLQTAAYLLSKHAEVKILLDGRTFSRRYQRDRVIEFCSQLGTTWATLECVCSEATAHRSHRGSAGGKQPPRRESYTRRSIAKSETHGSRSSNPNSLSTPTKTWNHVSIERCAI